MTEEKIQEERERIGAMSHLEMARLWRFAPPGHPYFDTALPLFEIFLERFHKFGCMTPAISKEIGL
jgi:hypothetical protein